MLNGIEREQKILDNIGLVKTVMKTVSYLMDDEEDILSEGMIGLIRAVDNYDPTFENQFSSFAYPYIRGRILDYFKKKPFENSLDDFVYDDGDSQLTKLDMLESDDDIQQSYEDDDLFKFRMNVIETVLAKVTENQANVYRMMMSGMSTSEIAIQEGKSTKRISQLIGIVDRRLNNYIFERGLRYV
jgi:RNA polymerase sporulation-specific sigma factor